MTSDPKTSGEGFPGTSGLNDPSDEFNTITSIIEQMIARVSTVKMVKVVRVKSAGEVEPAGFVDVQILVNQYNGRGQPTKHGVVNDVLYLRMQGGKNAIIMDPAEGDIGLLLICDRDSSAVVASKAQANAGSFRKYDNADGIYLGGILNAKPDQYMRFTADTMEWVQKSGNKLVVDQTGWEFTGLVKINGGLQLGGSIKALNGASYAQDIVTTADVRAADISLKGHKHTAQGAFAQTTPAQP